MTSTYLRKRQIQFPSTYSIRRLKRVDNFKKLGIFNIDKICIAFEIYWEQEDIKGEETYFKKQYNKSGEYVGTLYSREYKGQTFQIYIGKGKIRNIQFNPRHFNTLTEFIDFANEIIASRPYHLTSIHFSWLLYKTLASIVFLFWSIKVSNLKLSDRYPYVTFALQKIENGSFQGFVYGKSKLRIKAYDADEHNTNVDRKEKHKVHSVINFEVQLGRQVLALNGIMSLRDFRKIKDFSFVLKNVDFITPSVATLKNTRFLNLINVWKNDGATRMCREFYRLSKVKNYEILNKYFKTLTIKKSTYKKSLLDLAAYDFDNFRKGRREAYRYKKRIAVLDMPVLFDAEKLNPIGSRRPR